MENIPLNVGGPPVEDYPVEDHPYQYTRLASQDSFRLIKILPDLIDNQCISCIISEHSLAEADDVPRVRYQYRALSYVWGDPSRSKTIYLRDEKIACFYRYDIHVNLWQFLAHMWRKKEFECLLWTDRLCINQDDEQEKAHQIPRMGLIYSQAGSAIIWLGLSAWEEKYFQEHMEWGQSGARTGRMSQRPPEQNLAICSVLDHEYWSRMWIMQEVAMAQYVVVEMQETPSFDLEDLFRAVIRFNAAGGSRHSRNATFMLTLIDIRGETGMETAGPQSSWELIWLHCHRRCTNRHDHIYGLLGMLEEDDPILQIAIDYKQPASDVLFDALFTVTNPSLGSNNWKVLEALMDIGLLEDINSLEEYSNRDHSWKLTDNEVVKTFARIALGFFDALNLMETCSGLRFLSGGVVAKVWRPEPLDVDEFQWKAIIGMVLTAKSEEDYKGRGEQWKRRREQWNKERWPKFRTQSESLWLCSQHASQFVPAQVHVKTSITQDDYDFRPNDFSKTCRHYRQDGSLCDGSKMSLEVPDSGLRLELEYAAPTLDLAIWFQEGVSRDT